MGRRRTGAAGTDAKYHGKWTSLGGGSDPKANTPLQAAVIELVDEAYLGQFYPKGVSSKDDVWIPWKTLKSLLPSSCFSWRRAFPGALIFSFNEVGPLQASLSQRRRPRRSWGQAMVTASHGESRIPRQLHADSNVQLPSKKQEKTTRTTTLPSIHSTPLVSVVLPALSPRRRRVCLSRSPIRTVPRPRCDSFDYRARPKGARPRRPTRQADLQVRVLKKAATSQALTSTHAPWPSRRLPAPSNPPRRRPCRSPSAGLRRWTATSSSSPP